MPQSGVALAAEHAEVEGRAFLSGVEVLAHLMLLQRKRDEAAGLNTAGFVSGYRGSPLGGLDKTFWRWQREFAAHRIHFEPAINEELAATAVLGTQQLNLNPGARHDGVFAMWYGKGPGLDRAGDALKHCNSLGSSPLGGGLVVVGDDHGAVSSSMAHQCEQLMASWLMPVLAPASIREYLSFGLLGFAMSRFSGCFVGFKAVSTVVEAAASIELDPVETVIQTPIDFAAPEGGLHIRWPDPQLAQEARLHRFKIPAAQAFARANRIDRMIWSPPNARLGLVSSGKAYLDLRQALADLGVDEARAAALGIRLYKVGMPWPLEPQGAQAFAAGLDTIIAVEEKRGVIEGQLKELLYGLPDGSRPQVLGKSDRQGAPLLPTDGELDPGLIARALIGFLPGLRGDEAVAARMEMLAGARDRAAGIPKVTRPPYFCAGCPHNCSTKIPDGSRALAGTGCHLIVVGMQRNTSSLLHMGGDGVNWVGQSPFTDEQHIFQNLGDGTYVHSGQLAIRQAVAAGVNMTFKILYNDAVAMTGGQPPEGHPTVAQMSQQVYHEGVRHIALISEDPTRYRGDHGLAPGTTIHAREELEALQQRFRGLPGVSVIIYDWTCATERRRRRKRGRLGDSHQRVFINEAVCEGCGDCVVQSNCVAVFPVPTADGIKRRIDQSMCNFDFACLAGRCPALVTLSDAPAKPVVPAIDLSPLEPPQPEIPGLAATASIVLAGAGGSGVVTVGRFIGLAGHIEGKATSVLDFTGLAQKGGQVLTHVRIAPDYEQLNGNRIPPAGADLLIAGDLVTATSGEAVLTLRHGATVAIANSEVAATAHSVLQPQTLPETATLCSTLRTHVGEAQSHFLAATELSVRLTGEALGANLILLGYAWQLGRIPLQCASLFDAIERHGVSVAENKRCFTAGRIWAHNPQGLRQLLGIEAQSPAVEESIDALLARSVKRLVAYQNQTYADRYSALLARVREAEGRLPGASGGLTRSVAAAYYKLLAYKDEYEVARLFGDPAFAQQLADQFGPEARLNYHFALPLFGRTAEKIDKRRFGDWMGLLLRQIARMRGLRGTPFDPFGYQLERRQERKLVVDYASMIERVLAKLDHDNYNAAVALAKSAIEIRGYGPVKQKSVQRYEESRAELEQAFFGVTSRGVAPTTNVWEKKVEKTGRTKRTGPDAPRLDSTEVHPGGSTV